MKIKEFKIRASAVSQIMTNPQTKSAILSKTCKSYLEQWVKEHIYGVQKEIKSKYLAKGIDVESMAIEYYSEQRNLGFVLKNMDSFEDEFFTGTPDLIHDSKVYDLKSSWDCFTFPLFDKEPEKGYEEQLQIYMHLTGLKKSVLVYTLQNTPDELVFDEPNDYSLIDPKYRIKEFEIDYNSDFIKSVQDRVLLCRNYIQNII